GKITAISMQMHRNTPVNKPQWARPALLTSDLTPARLDWAAFQGDAQHHSFDPNRFVHWRYFWDYSGGSVFENMSQQLSFWYGSLNLDIPQGHDEGRHLFVEGWPSGSRYRQRNA